MQRLGVIRKLLKYQNITKSAEFKTAYDSTRFFLTQNLCAQIHETKPCKLQTVMVMGSSNTPKNSENNLPVGEKCRNLGFLVPRRFVLLLSLTDLKARTDALPTEVKRAPEWVTCTEV